MGYILGGAFGQAYRHLFPLLVSASFPDNECRVSSNAINGVPFSRFTVPNNETPLDSYSDKGAPRAEQAAWVDFVS